jgi:hypothetical protein
MPALELVVSDVRTMSNALSVRWWSGGIRHGSRPPFFGDLSGIGVPISPGGSHPVNSGRGVYVENLGEDGGGELAGEVHQGGTTTGHGGDAEPAEPLAEAAGVKGTISVEAGK